MSDGPSRFRCEKLLALGAAQCSLDGAACWKALTALFENGENNRPCECPLFSKMCEWLDRSNPQLCIAVQISVIHLVEFKLLALTQQRLHK